MRFPPPIAQRPAWSFVSLRTIALYSLLAFSPGLTSCWWSKPKPLPPSNLPPPPSPTKEIPKTPAVAPPPAIETKPTAPDMPETLPEAAPPPVAKKTKPPRRRPVVPAAPKQTPPATAPAEATPQQTPTPDPGQPAPPKLSQILTAEQTREYSKTYDASVDRIRRAVGHLEKKALTAEDSDALNRIRNFLKQAEEAKSQDLVTAVNLATRADLLARDLLARVP